MTIGIEKVRGKSTRNRRQLRTEPLRAFPILSAPSAPSNYFTARKSIAIYQRQPGYALLLRFLHGNRLSNLAKTYSAVFRRTRSSIFSLERLSLGLTSTPQALFLCRSLPPPGRISDILEMGTDSSADGAPVHTNAKSRLDILMDLERLLGCRMDATHPLMRRHQPDREESKVKRT